MTRFHLKRSPERRRLSMKRDASRRVDLISQYRRIGIPLQHSTAKSRLSNAVACATARLPRGSTRLAGGRSRRGSPVRPCCDRGSQAAQGRLTRGGQAGQRAGVPPTLWVLPVGIRIRDAMAQLSASCSGIRHFIIMGTKNGSNPPISAGKACRMSAESCSSTAREACSG
jgi:hypothetical protein